MARGLLLCERSLVRARVKGLAKAHRDVVSGPAARPARRDFRELPR